MGKTIEFNRPDGKQVPGYLAEAPHSGAPGVVMIEEWWGVTDHMKHTADLLASEGFNVLVPDLYRGRVAATRDEANHMTEGLDFVDATREDVAGALLYLRAHGAKKVGVTGFCIGGALTFLAAMYDPDVDSIVAWYGYPSEDAGDPSTIKIPVQAHWANEDGFFTPEGVDALEKKLKAGGVPYEFHRYDAEHGFHNPSELGKSGLGHHHPEHARTAWQRSVDFFKKTLA